MVKKLILICLCLSFWASAIVAQTRVTFKSRDGLDIAADYYNMNGDSARLILLFHQAGWSRGEYLEIAPKLNARGFNCLAVDLRSGNTVNNTPNITYQNARQSMRQTNYLDAYQDIVASVSYAQEKLGADSIILWGSSYSSSLVLQYAGEQSEEIIAALAFSPGEYFKNFGKPADYIATAANNINVPVFITSARSEQNSWSGIYEAINHAGKMSFTPQTSGNHGSRALWQQFPDHKEYWAAVDSFLDKL